MEDVFVSALMREEICDVHYGHDVRRALLYNEIDERNTKEN